MDTRLKDSRPFAAWFSFFMGISLLAAILLTGIAMVIDSNGNIKALKAPFIDYRETVFFKEQTGHYFNNLLSMVHSIPEEKDYWLTTEQRLKDEGINLKYYASDLNTGMLVNNTGELSFTSSGMPILPKNYKYYWYYDGHKLWVMDNGKAIDIERLDSGYRNIVSRLDIYPESPSTRAVLAVSDALQPNPYGHSAYYGEKQLLMIIGWVYIALTVLGLVLIVFALIKREQKRAFDQILASWLGRLWLEVKILISIIPLSMMAVSVSNSVSGYNELLQLIFVTVCLSGVFILGCWWFYLMFLDLTINRSKVFTNNMINAIIQWYKKYEGQYSWQKSMQKRVYVLVAAEAIMALCSVMFLLVSFGGGGGAFFIALLIAAAGIYLIYRYLCHYNHTIIDLGKLTDHIENMKNGDMAARLELDPAGDMYRTAQNLNSIQDGMSKAIAEKMKSERMKVDLITNVSHDLKTPLTSIISYVELLSKEEGLPEHVGDYIKILSQKSDRLKNLIQDLFDLSKASSEVINLDMDRIDLGRLIHQTLGDMHEQIADSGLTFRVNLPDEPVLIMGDGQKLYRVFENLIMNTLKYSLTGSRVFVDLVIDGQNARATIKNTANYEMNFTEEEILQRFVRGDESRSTEGSGLGMAIAQSFTQICKGQFEIKMDGDLFKVELSFPVQTQS